ncbi:MAG: CCA tRNA nucleotidyltransferase, partial [Planctomycetes bacterium]|nr:CCA tRNA nucleotidyltransferase [Planctomycetota bacterium]
RLKAAGHIALFAGGCVRDSLLGRVAKDFDVATTATPNQVRELFGHRRTLAVGASFGVIVVLPPRSKPEVILPVEVATFRSEGPYTDGRRPESVAFCSPEEDARRRDFTINGMFYDPIESRVLDYVGGEADLAASLVRAIGDPAERMTEDKLRMLRAVRFAATLEFELDSNTAEAVRNLASEIRVVSEERITQELKRMLVDPHRRRAIELSEQLSLLDKILPELFESAGPWKNDQVRSQTLSMLALLQSPSFELAFSTLVHAVVPQQTIFEICRRLRFSNDETDRVLWIISHQNELDQSPTLPLCRLKRLLAHSYRDDLIAFFRVRCLSQGKDLHPVMFVEEYLARTPQSI